MSEASTLERLLRLERLLTAAGLLVLLLLAWAYLLGGAGLDNRETAGMAGMDMAGMDMAGMAMPGMEPAWTGRTWLLTLAMWWTMMAAMMLGSAAPTILLYARVRRHSGDRPEVIVAPEGAFTAGYLLAWLLFAAGATVVQWALQRYGLLDPGSMGVKARWASAAVLLAAGAYQLSPIKDRCLIHCRSPAAFLSRHWRPGLAGALRLGLAHGAYCVGCCWLVMALLFVGGVMNLAWIAGLTLLVLAEKLIPGGRWVARASGLTLIVWAGAVLFA